MENWISVTPTQGSKNGSVNVTVPTSVVDNLQYYRKGFITISEGRGISKVVPVIEHGMVVKSGESNDGSIVTPSIINRALEEGVTCEITISGKSVYEGEYLINLSTVNYSFSSIADVEVPGFTNNLNKKVTLNVKGFDGVLPIYFKFFSRSSNPQIPKQSFLKIRAEAKLYDDQSNKFTCYFLFKFV